MVDPEYLKRLTSLPWELQLVLAAGYCAYLTAYVGIRHHHRTTDTIFASLTFGLIAYSALFAMSAYSVPSRIAIALVSAVGAGIIWRVVGRSLLKWIFRKTRYSWADDTPSAWEYLQENSRYGPTQLTVETDDGWTLYCTSAARADKMAFGPFVLGTSGDVLMYVDKSRSPDGEERDLEGVFDDAWGDLATYVPKDRIRTLSIRLTSRVAVAVDSEG